MMLSKDFSEKKSAKTRFSPSKEKKRIIKGSEPEKVYFRSLADLTLHGGITANGDLVVIPILPALGVKMKSLQEYCRQVDSLLRAGALASVLPELKLHELQSVNFSYPALTSSIPLPGPAALDHILGTAPESLEEAYQSILDREFADTTNGEKSPAPTSPQASKALNDVNTPPWFDPQIAEKQLFLAMNNPRWRPHRLMGFRVTEFPKISLIVEKILEMEDSQPGVLTKSFLKMLLEIQGYIQALKAAAHENQLVCLCHYEISSVLSGYGLNETGINLRKTIKDPWRKWVEAKKLALSRLRDKGTDLDHHMSLGTSWEPMDLGRDSVVLVSDVGYSRFLEFLNKMHLYQKSSFEFDSSAYDRSSCRKAITKFLTKLTLSHSKSKRFFTKSSPDLIALSQSIDRRLKPGSIASFFVQNLDSIAIGQNPTLIIKTDKTPQLETAADSNQPTLISISPVVLNPDFAAAKKADRNKSFPALEDRYQTLKEIETSGLTQNQDFHVYDPKKQWIWPNGRLWQMVEMLQSLLLFPEHFLSPEFLATNKATYNESFHDSPVSLSPGTSVRVETRRQWYDVIRLLNPFVEETMAPSNLVNRAVISHDGTTSGTSDEVEVLDGGLTQPQVSLGVRFEPEDSRFGELDIASLLDLLKRSIDSQDFSTKETQNLFETLGGLRFTPRPFFEVDGIELDPSEWFAAKKTKNGFFRIPSRDVMISEREYLEKTNQFELRQKVYAKYQNATLGSLWKIQMLALGKTEALYSPEEYLKHLTLKIAPIFQKIDSMSVSKLGPKLVKAHLGDLEPILRPYQVDGIAWAFARLALGFGICLADEMGLGKTIQAIGLMRVMKEHSSGGLSGPKGLGPILVVIPKSLILNWQRELRQFGAGIRVRHYGADASDLTNLAATSDLVLTTYARLRLDSKDFHAVKWSMVVLDEAHAIKNSGTQIAEVVRGLKAKLRVALTGTPVENRAGELWSLMDWLNPGYLGDQASFSQFTSLARSSSQKRMLMAPLRVCLDPLILRRLKKDPEVALGLPDKIFKDESFDLSSEQQLLYQSVVELCIAEGAETLSLFQRKGMYLRAILHLKQICIHPDLFLGTGGSSGAEEKENPGDPLFQENQKWSKKIKRLIRKLQMQQTSKTTKLEQWIRRSGKISGLNELIADHRSQCRGILIFTQYLGAAEMLQRMISLDYEMPIPPLIHGGLSPEKRQQLVDEFNSICASKAEGDDAPVLILSLKVGGSGLNLTGADCVIHLDRWWNPAVEDQATDRAHRIGQTSQVLVQTLTSPGTIEESVAAKFESKRQLSADLLGSVVEGDFGDDLRDEVGFLQLVDPQGMFRKSLRVLN